jgi:hypothetical protein
MASIDGILSELSTIAGCELCLFQHEFSYEHSKSYSATIELKTDGSDLKIKKSSKVSVAAALKAAWDEFKLRSSGWSKTELYPRLLEHQADEHEKSTGLDRYDLPQPF